MKRRLYFPEFLEMMENTKSRKDKIALIRNYGNVKGFPDILYFCYDPKIEFVVTRRELDNLWFDHMDIPDYDTAPTTLFNEVRRIRNYTTLRQPPLRHNKVLQLIANTFSCLHHEEIELFKQMVAGRIKCKGLTEKLVREAFPGLLSPEEKPVKKNNTKKSTPKKEKEADDKENAI
jgi:hypothetical protein